MKINMKTKVYLCGGMVTRWQEKIMHELAGAFDFINPASHGLSNPIQYTLWDIHYVKQCDILFCYMETTNTGGFGAAVEIGIAKALNKTIILVDEKSTTDESFKRKFNMVRETSDIIFDNYMDGFNYLKMFK